MESGCCKSGVAWVTCVAHFAAAAYGLCIPLHAWLSPVHQIPSKPGCEYTRDIQTISYSGSRKGLNQVFRNCAKPHFQEGCSEIVLRNQHYRMFAHKVKLPRGSKWSKRCLTAKKNMVELLDTWNSEDRCSHLRGGFQERFWTSSLYGPLGIKALIIRSARWDCWSLREIQGVRMC